MKKNKLKLRTVCVCVCVQSVRHSAVIQSVSGGLLNELKRTT